MKKYYFGLIIIGAVTIGLLIYTIILGSSSKQDSKTYKKANEIAKKLNTYISTNKTIPESLDKLGVSGIPATIKYTKNSDGTFKFCVTYKSASSYETDPTSLLWGSALKSTSDDSSFDSYSDDTSYQPSSLYLDYYHKKGENCQTVKPYVNNYNSIYDLQGGFNNTTNPNSSINSIQATAQDTERKTDLKAIASHLEVYYAQKGQYPTLTQMISSTWIAANLKGLDKEALRDPAGTSYTLLSYPTAKYYSYAPKADDGLSCSGTDTYPCTKFTLTAYLSSGSTFTVNSLN